MSVVSILLQCLPAFMAVGYGVFSILEVVFPSLRDPDFNHWEVDDNSGSSITFMGFTKVLKPPRVIAQGYMSDRQACTVALVAGMLCILIGSLVIRHIAGVPANFPDIFTGQR